MVTEAHPSPVMTEFLRTCVSDATQVRASALDTRVYSHDASHYLMYPEAVVVPKNAQEVSRLLRGAAARGIGLTFRSGGTSLSGQGQTDKVLVDVRRHFQDIEVLDDGKRVRINPGLTVDQVNAFLAPYGAKIGPDPASSRAATIGGVVNNNSSGMSCGTTENTYRTIDSLVVVLASGTIIDTGAPDADEKLRLTEPAIYEGLAKLRERVLGNPASVAKIKQQFSMKNTMGYSVNAFVDYERIIDIFTHLMVASEGTLGFIADTVWRTIPVKPHMRTALLMFEDVYHATDALPALVASKAATLELMDAMSLIEGQKIDTCPAIIKNMNVGKEAALILEYQAIKAEELAEIVAAAQPVLEELPLIQPLELSGDPKFRVPLWGVRNGLLSLVAGARKPGTLALFEDVVVPVPKLAETCLDLSKLFGEYGYDQSAIFGHARDGNVHFMITDRFEGEALDRFAGFTDALADLILGNDGALKAEHAAGRVMAPYVERQFGSELYDVMKEIKKLFDPTGMLNDEVLISADEKIHMKYIKPPVLWNVDYDRCSDCGFCEPVCPARQLTLTPRQRQAAQREIAFAQQTGDVKLAETLTKEYVYAGIQTCAVDGMCLTVCPLKINTGDLTRTMRAETVSTPVSSFWTTAAKHWQGGVNGAGLAMSATHTLSPLSPAIKVANRAARAVLGKHNMPMWGEDLPAGGGSRQRPPVTSPDIVYMPTCLNRMFGAADGAGVQAAFLKLCEWVGIRVLVPQGIDGMCCGTPWSSKGITKGYHAMSAKVLPTLREATDGGRRVVVSDASSCTEGLAKMVAQEPDLNVKVIDAVQFVAEHVLPRLGKYPKLPSLVLHQTCSSTQIGINPALTQVAQAVADKVIVPFRNGCCAFAGDRGLLHPELTKAATELESAEVARTSASAYASCNRTCEIGMSRATGKTYRHVLELLVEQVEKA